MSKVRNYNLEHKYSGSVISGSPDGFLTVGDVRDAISSFPDDAEVIFGTCEHGGELQFLRFKVRGEKTLAIEFG